MSIPLENTTLAGLMDAPEYAPSASQATSGTGIPRHVPESITFGDIKALLSANPQPKNPVLLRNQPHLAQRRAATTLLAHSKAAILHCPRKAVIIQKAVHRILRKAASRP